MQKLIVLVILISIVACGKKIKNKDVETVTKNPLITVDGWCQATEYDQNFFLINRFRILTDREIGQSVLKVRATEDPILYEKQKRIYYSSSPSSVEYSVKEINGSENVKGLKAYQRQERMVSKLWKKNHSLNESMTLFNPERAIIINGVSSSEGKDNSIELFPCSSFSDIFLNPIKSEPYVSLQVELGRYYQNILSKGPLVNHLALDLPLIVLKADELGGAQWCSWHEMGDGYGAVSTLTVKKNFFLSNFFTFSLLSATDDVSREVMSRISKDSKVYRREKSENKLSGSKDLDGIPYVESFVYVKDQKGRKALIRTYDENSNVYLQDQYFKCDDLRPFDYYDKVRSGLKRALQLESEQSYRNISVFDEL